MTDRAVSEVLGFVIVFTIIVSTVALVYVVGYGGLQDARDAERVTNAQRAFDVLADNVEDITHGRAPSRGTDVKLSDATLRVGEPIRVGIRAEHATNDTYNVTARQLQVYPVIFETDGGEQIVYAAGAVLRAGEGGTSMQRRPSFVAESERFSLVVPQTRHSGGQLPREAGGTVLVRMERSGSTAVVSETTGTYERVWYNVTSPRAGAWADGLESQGLSCTVANGTAQCHQDDVERLYVVIERIDVTFA